MKQITIGRVTLALLAAGLVCLSLAAVAAARGGNAANVKLCQNGGWRTLHRSDGSSFANQGQCVSYSAHGGTLSRASISLVDIAQGEFSDTFAVDGSGFTPNHSITFTESGLGPSGAVFSIGTVATDSSGNFVSGTINETDNFWNLIVAHSDGAQTIHVTATDGTNTASTTLNFSP